MYKVGDEDEVVVTTEDGKRFKYPRANLHYQSRMYDARAIMYRVIDGNAHVAVCECEEQPFVGRWILPGGEHHPDDGECPTESYRLDGSDHSAMRNTMKRTLKEKFGVEVRSMKLFRLYGDCETERFRNPRVRTISYVYFVEPVHQTVDNSSLMFKNFEDIFYGDILMGYDHRKIIRHV